MGSLPFYTTGELQALGGDVIEEDIPVSVWPASGYNAEAQRAYDHQGEAPLGYLAPLTVANRRLIIEGTEYALVECVAHPFVPHCALRLRRIDAGG